MRINMSMAHVVSDILVVDELVLEVGDNIGEVALAAAYLDPSAVLIDIQSYNSGGVSLLFHTTPVQEDEES